MSRRSVFLSVIVSILLLAASARSQAPVTSEVSDESAAVKKKAIALLESVMGEVNTLRSGENRARIGSNAAEALWEHDEKRARSIFAVVAEDIKAGFNDAEPDGERDNNLRIFWQLRSDSVVRIAKHDPESALEFLRATKPAAPLLTDEFSEKEKSLEVGLASQIAAKHPELTLKLVRQSMAKGFSNDLIALLAQLKQKDKETFRAIYKEIVEKLKGTDLEHDWLAANLAADLARSFELAEIDELVYRDLLGAVLNGALAAGCAEKRDGYSSVCTAAGVLFARIEKYYGSRAAPLKEWGRNSPDDSERDDWLKIRDVLEKGTIDETLALAQSYPQLQGQISLAAVQKATASGDFAKARQIASTYPDEEDRSYLIAQIDRDETWRSKNSDKLALVRQELAGLRSNEERIRFLFGVAAETSGNDRKTALLLLNQAGQLIDSFKPGRTQLQAKVALAIMYCSFKSDRGFAIMESLMPKLNDLVSAAATLDRVETYCLSDGEWSMTGGGTVGDLLRNISQNVGYFAWLDFDRAVTLANQLERPELRLMAELKIAQSVLVERPDPGKTPPTFQLY